MKRKLPVFVLACLLGCATLMTNCKKDDPTPSGTPAPAPQTNTQKISDKNWKMTEATVDPAINMGTVTITNWYSQMEECSKDDIVRFKTDGTLTFDEGATKCDASDPQTTSGTWVWNTDETIITVTSDGETESYNIIQNDGTTLKFSFVENLGGTNYTMTFTFKKQ